MATQHPIPTHPRFKDLTGKRFGRLTVLGYAGRNISSRNSLWSCACDCGQSVIIVNSSLLTGHSKSCGCLGHENAKRASTKHEHCPWQNPSLTYKTWVGIKDRCLNPRNNRYPEWGGRGICMCERWQESFAAFLADMGERPGPEYSIDRFPNNDGNYEPGNCRWATRSQQARNTRRTRILTLNGLALSLPEWAERVGIKKQTLWARIFVYGWPVERALTE